MAWLPSFVLFPASVAELTHFYLLWMLLFLGVHVVWDWLSASTPALSLVRIAGKNSQLYAASTFASSFVLVLGLIDQKTSEVVGASPIPIILAGLSGLLNSFGSLVPQPDK